MADEQPSAASASQIVRDVFGEEIASIARFPTGRCHYVFDVVAGSGRKIVVRIAEPQNRAYIEGGVYWSKLLRPMGVPLPRLLAADTEPRFPYMILERLEGTDLGNIYSQLSSGQKQSIASRVNEMQQIVSVLASGNGFGYATSREQLLHRTWWDAIEELLVRSEKWIKGAGVVDPAIIGRLRGSADGLQDYFAQMRPTPFLDDLTTRNVIVADGELTGVVDIDEVCFGDPLFTPSLVRMSLLSSDFDTQYVEFLCPMDRLSRTQRRAFTFYTAHACVVFLSELGQQFNCDQTPEVTEAQIKKLRCILDALFDELRHS